MAQRFIVVLFLLYTFAHVDDLRADSTQKTTVLFPINAGTTVGAFGSEWRTELAIANLSNSFLRVEDLRSNDCNVEVCFGYIINAHTTLYLDKEMACPNGGGCLGHVDTSRISDLSFTLRTRDLSRQSATWGVVVPVVLGTDFFDKPFSLVDVPNDPQFRATLRLYDADPSTLPQVKVRVFGVNPIPYRGGTPDSLLIEFTPSFSAGSVSSLFAAVSQTYLWDLPSLASASRLRIEVIPLDARKDYWGFVSVTHNDTQEVTVITP